MKTRNLFAVLVFVMAIGSAFASEYLVPTSAWTRKADVPAQFPDCMERTTCDGTSQACTVNIDHDGSSSTPNIDVRLYDSTCATALFKN